MAKVTYIGPFAQVAVPTPTGDIVVAQGETVDLPDDIVHGTPAVGDPPTIENGFHSPGYRPGIGGLVDQTDIWTAPKTASKKSTTASDPRKES